LSNTAIFIAQQYAVTKQLNVLVQKGQYQSHFSQTNALLLYWFC